MQDFHSALCGKLDAMWRYLVSVCHCGGDRIGLRKCSFLGTPDNLENPGEVHVHVRTCVIGMVPSTSPIVILDTEYKHYQHILDVTESAVLSSVPCQNHKSSLLLLSH